MKVALLGYGTVGRGVVEVIRSNQKRIDQNAGDEIEIKYILDIRDIDEKDVKDLMVKDFEVILKDEEVDIVVEAMGGIEPAYTYAKAALLQGKSYITSNKELVALHGSELIEIAHDNNVNFLFEASVGGGIPIIRPLNQSLTADEIYEITGILNGTTNYILTKMKNEGSSFEDVLKEAQELGYAERNPEADVEGHDACRKIAILSSLAFGVYVSYQDIPTEGITKITKEDMQYATNLGCVIKLLATCKKQDGSIFARVAPMMVKQSHPLAMVNDVFNGIFVKGNALGDAMFYGRGAGKLPTASAMVADIVDAVKHKGTHIISRWGREKIELKDKQQVKAKYFVRIQKDDLVINTLLKNLFRNIKVIDALPNEYAFITSEETEKYFENHFETLKKNVKVLSTIRIEN